MEYHNGMGGIESMLPDENLILFLGFMLIIGMLYVACRE